MAKASLGAGDVDIVLDGETVTLKPSLKAAQAISRQAGGIMGALKGLSELDFDIVTGIIAVGLGRQADDVAGAVWRTGIANLVPGASEFVTVVANGGRRRPKDGGSEAENPPVSNG